MTGGESMIGQSIAAAADVMGAVNREIPNRFDLAHSLTKRKQNARFVTIHGQEIFITVEYLIDRFESKTFTYFRL